MGLEALQNVANSLASTFSFNTSPLANILVAVGFVILLLLFIGIIIYGLVKFAKVLPTLSVKQFLIVVAAFGVFLILLGVILP
jgi:flagellar biogenesis protein FliO